MKDHEIGDRAVEPELLQKMRAMGDVFDEYLNEGLEPGDKRKVGFVLMVFPFGLTHDFKDRVSYLSTADRKDILCMLKEQVARFEGRMLDKEGKT
jgi:hypothetical protein